MSASSVVDLVVAMLRDETFGISAKLARVVSDRAIDPSKVRTEFDVSRWRLPTPARTSTQANVMVRSLEWRPNLIQGNLRDAVMTLQVGAEWFNADDANLFLCVDLTADALALAFDGLRDYSDLNRSTVIDVIDPIVMAFGQFEGPVSHGFLATIQIQEQTAYVS
jgi:hypothetical protein